MSTAERNVVTVKEGAGVNQALALQCSLVTLKDSPRKSPKARLPLQVWQPEGQVLWQLE